MNNTTIRTNIGESVARARVSRNSAWPLKRADGKTTWAQAKQAREEQAA